MRGSVKQGYAFNRALFNPGQFSLMLSQIAIFAFKSSIKLIKKDTLQFSKPTICYGKEMYSNIWNWCAISYQEVFNSLALNTHTHRHSKIRSYQSA